MDPTLFASLIAACGVIISALISYGIADRTARHQITRVRYEIQHSKAEKLAEKRLEVYPALYFQLNKLNFLLRDEKLEARELNRICTSMQEWYLQNGLLMSTKSNTKYWLFIKQFRRICRGGKNAIANSLGGQEQREEFINTLESVELELKNEIGVFEIEYFDPKARFSSYHELASFDRKKIN